MSARSSSPTILQELEWHFHAALFALVLGYGVIYNTHVRIDLIRENLAFRKKAWLEFVGLTFFMIPFCAVVIWFAFDYVLASYAVQEGSASTVGLPTAGSDQERAGLRPGGRPARRRWPPGCRSRRSCGGRSDLRFPLMTLEWPEEDRKIEGKDARQARGRLRPEARRARRRSCRRDAPRRRTHRRADCDADGPQLGKALQALRLA